MRTSNIRTSDTLAIATWAGAIFGLAEGVVLLICNAFPAVLAPYKMSADVLWVAPALNVLLFGLVALVLCVAATIIGPRLRQLGLLVVIGVFIFLGVFGIASAPKIIHILSALVLSIGVAVACCRAVRGHEVALTAWLRGRLLWVPAMIIVAALAAFGYERGRERWLASGLAVPPAGAPNVIVLVMDTVRLDSFNHAAARTLTPNLDRIAADGVQFENAWATSSWSLASQASILTGLYPHEHGADWPALQLTQRYQTVAEIFARLGYATGAFSGNAAWVTPPYLGRGFLRFDVYTLEDLLRRTVYGRMIGRALWEVGLHYAGRGKKAHTVNAEFLKFLNDYPNRPFFAYLCYMDVNQAFHNRLLNRPFWTEQPSMEDVKHAYDDGLRALDAQIGDLLDILTKRGIFDNTLLIITSDHGQSFGETTGTGGHREGHGTSLYPEQVQVPLFIIFSNRLPAGRSVSWPVSLKRIAATIAYLLELKDHPFADAPLPVTLELEAAAERSPILTTLNYEDRNLRSVVWENWLYLEKGASSSEELYDLTKPITALNNQANAVDLGPFRQRLQDILSARSDRLAVQ